MPSVWEQTVEGDVTKWRQVHKEENPEAKFYRVMINCKKNFFLHKQDYEKFNTDSSVVCD